MKTPPVEILTDIFLLCLPAPPTPLHPDDAPILLTRVCRQWRGLALTTPQLWTTLRLANFDHPSIVPALQQWLSLSRTLPLTIDIDISKPNDNHSISQNVCIKAICGEATRWSTLQLRPFHSSALRDISHFLSPSYSPILEKLALGFHRTDNRDIDSDDSLHILESLAGCQRLTSLSLTGWAQVLSLRLSPSLSLRHLCLSFHCDRASPLRIPTFVQCMSNCTMLESLELDLPFTYMAHPTHTSQTFALPHLRILKMTLGYFDLFCEVFLSFSVPTSLEEFYITTGDNAFYGPAADWLAELFSNCSRTLRKVHIDVTWDHMFEYPRVRSSFSHLYALQSLSIRGLRYFSPYLTPVLRSFILDLSHDSSPQNIVLQHLLLAPYDSRLAAAMRVAQGSPLYREFFESVIDLVRSRRNFAAEATTSDGEKVHRLSSFVFEGLPELYKVNWSGESAYVADSRDIIAELVDGASGVS